MCARGGGFQSLKEDRAEPHLCFPGLLCCNHESRMAGGPVNSKEATSTVLEFSQRHMLRQRFEAICELLLRMYRHFFHYSLDNKLIGNNYSIHIVLITTSHVE